jgi:hypothetical protein
MQTGKIRILGGSLSGTDVPVSTRLVVGRDPTCAQLIFPSEDSAVSRQHCEIRFDAAAARFEIRDLGSRNGTFVVNASGRARRLAPNITERLAPGQNILVGSSRNRFLLELDQLLPSKRNFAAPRQAAPGPRLRRARDIGGWGQDGGADPARNQDYVDDCTWDQSPSDSDNSWSDNSGGSDSWGNGNNNDSSDDTF